MDKNVKIKLLYGEIMVLKAKLKSTNDKAINYAEGVMGYAEYQETKLQREQWRAEINAIESQIKELGGV